MTGYHIDFIHFIIHIDTETESSSTFRQNHCAVSQENNRDREFQQIILKIAAKTFAFYSIIYSTINQNKHKNLDEKNYDQ